MKRRAPAAALACLLLQGCISLGTMLANAPTYVNGPESSIDIAYGPGPAQKLDIYELSGGSSVKPVIVFIYGGRWTSGAKADYRFVAAKLTESGYMVVIPDYAKYPDVKFPALMDDPARSLAWVSEHIGAYGGDASRIYLMGHSAGAHMAALLISDMHYLKKYNAKPTIVRAFCGLAGPYAFTPDAPDLVDMFGPPERFAQMQVPTFITGKEPSMLLLRGADDTDVGAFNLTRLEKAITAHGGTVQTKTYPGVGHIGIIASFATLSTVSAPVAHDCLTFYDSLKAKR